MSWSGTGLQDNLEVSRPSRKISPDDVLKDFISEYVSFYSELNKAVPRDYIEACAIFAIASVIGGRVSIRTLASGEEKPNVFVILLGASSISHKTTPLKVVERVLRGTDEVDFLSGRFSIEGMIMDLSNSPWGVVIRDEFTGLLAEVSKSYVQELKEFLCEMYDRKIGTRSTIKYGKVVIKDPCNSFLSATTPDNLSSKLKREDYAGGYLPRHLLMCPEPIYDSGGIDMMSESDMSVEFKIIQTLKFIVDKFPKGTLTDIKFEGFVDKSNPGDAYKLFNEWVIVNKAIAKVQKEDVEPFYARLVDYFIKLCIIFQLSDTSTDVTVDIGNSRVSRYIVITKKTAERVVAWMNNYRSFHLNRALRVLSNVEIERVYNTIRSLCNSSETREITYSDILRASNRLSKDLRPFIQTLDESDRIIVRKTLNPKSLTHKATEYIKLNEKR